MYPSDYGYSTSATDNECESSAMESWRYSGNVQNCLKNSWLYNSSYTQWTLMPIGGNDNGVVAIYAGTNTPSNFNASNDGTNMPWTSGAKPVLFLKSNVKISSGTGTSEDPYLLTQ